MRDSIEFSWARRLRKLVLKDKFELKMEFGFSKQFGLDNVVDIGRLIW